MQVEYASHVLATWWFILSKTSEDTEINLDFEDTESSISVSSIGSLTKLAISLIWHFVKSLKTMYCYRMNIK